MKTPSILIVAIHLATGTRLPAQDGILDLSILRNYANQGHPPYINRDNTPGNNPITNSGATLGRVLFHDRRLSRDNSVSCSSCHDQSHAFSDTATASTGVAGTTGRHAMRLINARFGNEPRFFWNERATSLENQTTQPVRDHAEMGFSGGSGDPAFSDLVIKLTAIPEYRVMFAMTFGDATITETRIQRSLAQFVRSIQSFDSKYDAGRAVANDNQPFPDFTPQENAGKQLFLAPPGPGPGQGGAGCAACHAPPEFDVDPNTLNNGVTAVIGGGTDLTNTRSPTLRDLLGPGGQSNGAFMHNASLATLADVINHYNSIPADNANLDPRLRRPGGGPQNLNLTQPQKDSLAAFLRTLTGTNVYTDEKWSDPFNANNELQLIILPADASRIVNNPDGSVTLRCQAAANLTYQLEASGDLEHWSPQGTLVANDQGVIQQNLAMAPPAMYYRFTYTPPAP